MPEIIIFFSSSSVFIFVFRVLRLFWMFLFVFLFLDVLPCFWSRCFFGEAKHLRAWGVFFSFFFQFCQLAMPGKSGSRHSLIIINNFLPFLLVFKNLPFCSVFGGFPALVR